MKMIEIYPYVDTKEHSFFLYNLVRVDILPLTRKAHVDVENSRLYPVSVDEGDSRPDFLLIITVVLAKEV